MTTEEFYTEWNRRCEAAVIRDRHAFYRRREAKLAAEHPTYWHEYWQIWNRCDELADKLADRAVLELGLDRDEALEAALDIYEADRERQFEALGFNAGVR